MEIIPALLRGFAVVLILPGIGPAFIMFAGVYAGAMYGGSVQRPSRPVMGADSVSRTSSGR